MMTIEPVTSRAVPTAAAAEPTRTRRRRLPWRMILLVVAVLAVGLAATLAVRAVVDDGPTGSASAPELVDEGLQLHVEGDLAGAADNYRAAIAADEANVLAHYNLGLVHQLEGRTADAEREYARTVELAPTYAPALHNLGVLAATAGNTDQAIDWYRQAVAADPDFASAQFNLGLLLLEAGDTDGGNAAIQEAIQIDSTLESRLERATP